MIVLLDGKRADPHGEPTRANIVCLSLSSCQPSRNHGAQLREIRRMTGKAQPGACHRHSRQSNNADLSTGDTLLLHCESLSLLRQLRLIVVQTQGMARSSRGASRTETSVEDTTNVRFDRAQSLPTMLNETSLDIVPCDALNPEDKEKMKEPQDGQGSLEGDIVQRMIFRLKQALSKESEVEEIVDIEWPFYLFMGRRV